MAQRIFVFIIMFVAFAPAKPDVGKTLRRFEIEAPTPVIAALGQLGLHVESDYISFGIDLRLEKDEPKVTLHLQPGQDTNDALLQIVAQLPGYTFAPVSRHLVNVYNAAAWSDPQDALNIRVPRFEVRNEPPMNILSNPTRFIPELKKRVEQDDGRQRCGTLGPGIGSIGPGITLTLENVTVREILNRVADSSSALAEQADSAAVVPLGWIHILHVAKPGTKERHEWRAYSTATKEWRSTPTK